MSKRSEIRIALEKFLRVGDGKGSAQIVRDQRRRPILIPESLVDYDRITKGGRAFLELGRRIRILGGRGKEGDAVWVLPTELTQISRDEPSSAAGVSLPFGTLVQDRGLWLKWAPGYRELGVSDRGDVLVRYDEEAAKDPLAGPVEGAVHTQVTGRVRRLVARLSATEHKADREEAEVWLKAMAALGASKTLKVDFKCAGVDCTHLGNVPYLQRTAKLNFFDVRDSEMLRIQSLLRLRFRKVRREIPRFTVYSLMGVPADANAWGAFQKRLKAAKKDPDKLGIPAKIADSRFYDPVAKAIVPSSFVFFPPLSKHPQELAVVTVNTDLHGEVKGRGVVSPMTSIMSLIEVISARASVAVLNKAGTATSFLGPTGCGKSTAAIFWAEKNDKYRRAELRRRYESDLRRTPDAGRLGETGIQKQLDLTLTKVGIACQEDWIEILKEGAGHWIFWPTERGMYARTSSFAGLPYVLSQNRPLLENVAADFGGSGDPALLGRVDHACFPERVFYDPEWGHLVYDASPRQIAINVFLERNPDLPFLVRRATAREAVDWLLMGRTPEGGFEPLHNTYPDFCGVLMDLGIVGDKLVPAYEQAQRGDYAALGGGDAALGELIYQRLDVVVKLWLDNCREVPTFVLNGAHGLDLTQDAAWLLSEFPTVFGGWKLVTVEEFRKHMGERYAVVYGRDGEWLHVSRPRA